MVPCRPVGRKMLVALVALVACGDNDRLAGAITGDSPVARCAHDEGPKVHAYSGFELEPSLAIDPRDERHLVATWQQDRWNNGGAVALAAATTHDGGAHWTRSVLPFSTCAGGAYDRASDPWVAISPDGAAYVVGIAFDAATARSAMVASRSTDGRTWDAPTELVADDSADVFNDKDSITADPRTPGRAWATWDRLTGLSMPDKPVGRGPAWLARATDGMWEPARAIYDPGADAQTIGNVIAVLGDGTLVDAFMVITMESTKTPTADIVVIRSTDAGDTWSAPIHISAANAFGATAPDGVPVRTGAGLPQIAADGANVYVAWEDSLALDHDAIAFSASRDGGLTWSAPVAINGAPEIPAFTPQIAAAGGAVAVTYYDFRDAHGLTTAWLATSADAGATWTDEAIAAPFQLAPARVGSSYFLGDYEGLVPGPRGFIPLVTLAFADNDPTDIVIRP